MQMSKKKSPRWLFSPLLLAVILLPLVLAQAPVEDPQKPPPATGPARPAEPAGQAETPATGIPSQQAPSKSRPARPQPGFTPSEKIAADSAVSFPVDI